jgi:hypothetical protein
MRKVSWLLMVVMATVLGVLASVGIASSNGAPGRLVGAIVFTGRVPHGASKNRYQRGWVVV